MIYSTEIEIYGNHLFKKKYLFNNNQLIISISSSKNHICIIFDDGKSISCGDNSFGQLGIGNLESSNEFQNVLSENKFIKVYSGLNFTFWKTSENDFYLSGLNKYLIPTKYNNDIILFSCFEKTVSFINNENILIFYPNFENNEIYFKFNLMQKPLEISCGYNFVIILINGSIFYFNENIQFLKIFQNNSNFLKIKSSYNYFLALDINENLYLNDNIFGFKRINSNIPFYSNILNFYPFKNHLFFQNNKFEYYFYGDNNYLQNPKLIQRVFNIPTKFEINKYISLIEGNYDFTIFIFNKFDKKFLNLNFEEFVPGQITCCLDSIEDLLPI